MARLENRMKMTTEVWLGVRNVGDATSLARATKGTVANQLLALARYLSENTMATRFQINIARRESDALRGLTASSQDGASDDLAAELERMIAAESDSETEA
jgi:hypothetical protein